MAFTARSLLTKKNELLVTAGIAILSFISSLFAESDTSAVDRPVAQSCKNYIGYTAGAILLDGISYRRWITDRMGLQVTISVQEQSTLNYIADSNRTARDTLDYSTRPRTVGIACFFKIFRIRNLGAVGFLSGNMWQSHKAGMSTWTPQMGLGGGIEYTIWRFTTMAVISMSQNMELSPPMWLDFGCYFAF